MASPNTLLHQLLLCGTGEYQSRKKITTPPPTTRTIQMKMLANNLPRVPWTWNATAPLCRMSMNKTANGNRATGASMKMSRERLDRLWFILWPRRKYTRRILRKLRIRKISAMIKCLCTLQLDTFRDPWSEIPKVMPIQIGASWKWQNCCRQFCKSYPIVRRRMKIYGTLILLSRDQCVAINPSCKT